MRVISYAAAAAAVDAAAVADIYHCYQALCEETCATACVNGSRHMGCECDGSTPATRLAPSL